MWTCRGRINDALRSLKKQLKLAKTRAELKEVLALIESIESQVGVQEKFNIGKLRNVLLAPEPE